ncbi:hypothetical protein CC2G_000179 [Coprinopsis cinerea AmutBmut pab1-1]|nr:hypothetical protein CC2G_000179 [Coprinopsis cinerea AmutBmut pab1-1]
MSPSFDMGEGLSLRHLPDASNASFSFQIPTSTRTADYLLADDGEDFFNGVDDLLATPAPPRLGDRPLRLSDLTPRPSGRNDSKAPCPPEHHAGSSELLEDNKPSQRSPRTRKSRVNTARPKPSAITRLTGMLPKADVFPASPAGERIDNLKAQVSSLADDRETIPLTFPSKPPPDSAPPPVSKHNPAPNQEPSVPQNKAPHPVQITEPVPKARRRRGTIVAPSMNDCRSGMNAPRFSSDGPSTSKPPDGVQATHADSSGDSVALGGIAARLLTYSEQILTTAEHVESGSKPTSKPVTAFSQDSMAGTSAPCVPSTSTDDSPLTLSQLSPEKPRSEARRVRVRQGAVEEAPPPKPLLTSSSKRPAGNPSDDGPARKRAKPNAPSAPDKGSTSNKSAEDVPPTRKVVRRRSSGSRSRSTVTGEQPRTRLRTSGTTRVTRSSRSSSLNKSESEREKANASSSTGGTSRAVTPRLRDSHHKETKIKSEDKSSLSRPSTEQVASGSTSSKRSVIRATIPHEFNFHVDARLEARNRESQQSDRLGGSSKANKKKGSIPDFKARREAELPHRKENIQPVVPQPFKFELDSRLKERAKFEEMIREKELQRHRELEQKRREREEEEEREIRELRRKLIPKANEVPEWYKDAPKKVKGG